MALTPTRKLKRGATVGNSVALVTDSSGNATTAATTATEIGYVSGVTSAIQTQITAKAAKAGDTFTGLVQFSGTTHAGIQLISLTTAQRDALTPANGMLIYNSTVGAVQKYDGGTWATLSVSGVPGAHASTHQNGGSDEIATATPGANAIPKAGGGGTLAAGWIPAGAGLQLYDENPSSPTAPNASGTNAFAIGSAAVASGTESVAIGEQATASNTSSFCIGTGSTASGTYAFAFGSGAAASADRSFAFGEFSSALLPGKFAFAHYAVNSVVGDAQSGLVHAKVITTNATPSQALIHVAESIALPNNTTWAFKILVVARRTDADGENDAWEITGLIHRDANAASTTLDASQINQIGATAWACSVSADTTNGALQIDVTGAAAKTIQWVARIETTETTG